MHTCIQCCRRVARADGYTHRHPTVLHGLVTLSRGLDVDLTLRGVDELPAAGIDAYVERDAHVGIGVAKDVLLSLAGRNLLNKGNSEFCSGLLTVPGTVDRTLYASVISGR